MILLSRLIVKGLQTLRGRSQLIRPSPNPPQRGVQSRSQTTTTTTTTAIARRKITRVPWLQRYLDTRPDFRWLHTQHVFKRSRADFNDNFLGWIHPEGFPFLLCGMINVGYATYIFVNKTFTTDPETHINKFRNRGYYPTAYRALDEINGFQTPDDLHLPFHIPPLLPVNTIWPYSKRFRDAEATRTKWLLARKTKWEQIERPKLVQQVEEMERQLAMQLQLQQQQQEEAGEAGDLEVESLEADAHEDGMSPTDTSE